MADRTLPGGRLDAAPPAEAPGEEPIRIGMDKRIDLALALVVAATGAYICYLASQFRSGSFPDPVTARGLPYFTGGFMIFAGLFHAGRRLLTWSSMPGNHVVSEGKEDDPAYPSSALRSFAIIALAMAWVALLRPLGYLIVTPPLLLAALWLMQVRSPGKLFGFAFGFTFIVWSIFSQVLNVILPLGPLTALARAWGLTP